MLLVKLTFLVCILFTILSGFLLLMSALDSVPEFISQRRRWLNGAFFAAVYSIFNAKQIWHTDHTLARKILLHIEFVYQFFNLVFTYFGLVSASCPSSDGKNDC